MSRGSIASLPMRNWNKIFFGFLKTFFKLRAYLWGIETISYVWARILKNFNCEPTYEELKLRWYSEDSCSGNRLRAYLWGIETDFIPLFNSYKFLIASLPMRNWNFVKLKCSATRMDNCEPTYEELKHFCHTIASFSSGYCEPTYEELKPPSTRYPQVGVASIASLPMRNWNCCLYHHT